MDPTDYFTLKMLYGTVQACFSVQHYFTFIYVILYENCVIFPYNIIAQSVEQLNGNEEVAAVSHRKPLHVRAKFSTNDYPIGDPP